MSVQSSDNVTQSSSSQLSTVVVSSSQTPDSKVDIWNQTQWFSKNQKGITPGEIRFCELDWKPVTVKVGHPLVTECRGSDQNWLSYHVSLQKFHRNVELQQMNGHFAVVISHGRTCENPPNQVGRAPQADCHNWDEPTVIKGQKCVRKDIQINSFGSDRQCFIVYCTNHAHHCDLWIKGYWRKFFRVNPSEQTLRIGTNRILITGENFASNTSLIKSVCFDDRQRRLECRCTWVNQQSGREAVLSFAEPISRVHCGNIWLRMDSDSVGWSHSVRIGVLIDEVYPWVSMTVMLGLFLLGFLPTMVAVVGFRLRDLHYKVQKKKEQSTKIDREKVAEEASEWTIEGI